MRYVKQRHTMGCSIACLAMITGHGYNKVRRWFRDDPIIKGLDTVDIISYLSMLGFWCQIEMQRKRSGLIPCYVFADFHICIIEHDEGHHAVVVDDEGQVYDPSNKGRGALKGVKVPVIIGIKHRNYSREALIQ